MALIDVVKCEMNSRELVYKFPSEDLRVGSQLVVYTGQTAFFVKGGKIMDQFESGTYAIKTENIPLLNKVINLTFGGNSPFQAEVWFINKLAIMDAKWGTSAPIQLEDPKYGVIVPVRAFGQYEIKVSEPRIFLETLIGNMPSFTTDKVNSYFRGKMMSFFTNLISDKMTKDGISVLNINSYLVAMSEYVREQLAVEFSKYGVSLESFNIMSINVPEDDPSFVKLKEAKDLAAQVKITGRDIYQMNRTFGVLDKAAANEGEGGSMIGMGIGLGAGVGVGNQMGAIATQAMTVGSMPPPLPQTFMYYIAINGQQQGPFDMNAIIGFIQNQQINMETLVWKQGMPSWSKISALSEFASFFSLTPPPIPSNQ